MPNYKLESEKAFRSTLLSGGRVTHAARLRHLSYVKTEAKSTFANKWDMGFIDAVSMPRPLGKIYREESVDSIGNNEVLEQNESVVVFQKKIK